MVNGESEEERSDPLSGLGRSTDVGGVIIFFDGNADLERRGWKKATDKARKVLGNKEGRGKVNTLREFQDPLKCANG